MWPKILQIMLHTLKLLQKKKLTKRQHTTPPTMIQLSILLIHASFTLQWNFKILTYPPTKDKRNSSKFCSLQEWKSRQMKLANLKSTANSTYLSTSILLSQFFFLFLLYYTALKFECFSILQTSINHSNQ